MALEVIVIKMDVPEKEERGEHWMWEIYQNCNENEMSEGCFNTITSLGPRDIVEPILDIFGLDWDNIVGSWEERGTRVLNNVKEACANFGGSGFDTSGCLEQLGSLPADVQAEILAELELDDEYALLQGWYQDTVEATQASLEEEYGAVTEACDNFGTPGFDIAGCSAAIVDVPENVLEDLGLNEVREWIGEQESELVEDAASAVEEGLAFLEEDLGLSGAVLGESCKIAATPGCQADATADLGLAYGPTSKKWKNHVSNCISYWCGG